VNDNVATKENQAVPVNVMANDKGGLGVSSVGTPAHGSASLNPKTYIVTYTPAPGYIGSDSFTYVLTNGVTTSTATVFVTITGNGPVAQAQSISVNQNSTAAITLQAVDDGGNTVTYSIVSNPSHGTITGFDSATGKLNYTASAKYHGADSFQFKAYNGQVYGDLATISITVKDISTPVGIAQSVETNGNTSKAITLNATDWDGDSLTYSITHPPQNGTVKLVGSTATYAPVASFVGVDSFNFTASDGTHTSQNTTVTITVKDTPTATPTSANTPQNRTVIIPLSGSDPDKEPVTKFYIATNPAHGVVSISGSNASYAPSTYFHGTDVFSYLASDGSHNSTAANVTVTVTETIAPVAHDSSVIAVVGRPNPINLTATEPDGDNLAYSIVKQPVHAILVNFTGNHLLYRPTNNSYFGNDSFTFRANDGVLDSNNATVNVSIITLPPAVVNLNLTTTENTSANVTLVVHDPRNLTNTFSIVTPPTHGSLSAVQGDNVTYIPNLNFHGNDTFTYKANNGIIDSNTATVTVTVRDTTIPVGLAQTVGLARNTALTMKLNATDADLDHLKYIIVQNPARGNVTNFNASTGQLTYTPLSNFSGIDAIRFVANDGTSNSTLTIVRVVVERPPIAQSQTNDTAPVNSTGVQYTLAATDLWPPFLTYSIVSQPLHGTVTLAGSVATYIPNPGYSGPDSFTCMANNRFFNSNVATVSITVS
jgi:hypothetical protein